MMPSTPPTRRQSRGLIRPAHAPRRRRRPFKHEPPPPTSHPLPVIKFVRIFAPTLIRTDIHHFRALVQEMTGNIDPHPLPNIPPLFSSLIPASFSPFLQNSLHGSSNSGGGYHSGSNSSSPASDPVSVLSSMNPAASRDFGGHPPPDNEHIDHPSPDSDTNHRYPSISHPDPNLNSFLFVDHELISQRNDRSSYHGISFDELSSDEKLGLLSLVDSFFS